MNLDREFYSIDGFLPICDALRDLVPFAQFKKLGKHPWRSVTFSKVAGFYIFHVF